MLQFYLAALETDEQKMKLELIYSSYYQMMLKVATQIIRDPDLAEDAVHETFLQILNEIDHIRIDDKKQLKSYLFLITRERTIDFLRRWERRKDKTSFYDALPLEDSCCEPEDIAITNLQLENAIRELSQMPEVYKRALTLRVKGYSTREIAEIMNCSEANVKNRIHRARAVLLKHFYIK